MIIKKYTGKTEAEAIELAKKELGNAVVIMNVKEVKSKGIFSFLRGKLIEITVALEEEQERLANALGTLSAEERDLIILHYYSEHTLLHVAELMHRPYGQIKRLHAKALKNLKLQMDSPHLRVCRI